MKLTAIFTTALLFATGTVGLTNIQKCHNKNPAVNVAINHFCKNHHILVPGHYASYGRQYRGIRASIHGWCDPKAWVPSNWCRSQFRAICASSGQGGRGTRHFGSGGCQQFTIGSWGIVITPAKRDEGNGTALPAIEEQAPDMSDVEFEDDGEPEIRDVEEEDDVEVEDDDAVEDEA